MNVFKQWKTFFESAYKMVWLNFVLLVERYLNGQHNSLTLVPQFSSLKNKIKFETLSKQIDVSYSINYDMRINVDIF